MCGFQRGGFLEKKKILVIWEKRKVLWNRKDWGWVLIWIRRNGSWGSILGRVNSMSEGENSGLVWLKFRFVFRKNRKCGKGQDCFDEVLDVRFGILYFFLVIVVNFEDFLGKKKVCWEFCVRKRESRKYGDQIGSILFGQYFRRDLVCVAVGMDMKRYLWDRVWQQNLQKLIIDWIWKGRGIGKQLN